MVSLIFVHEMGHVIAMKKLGIKVGAMTFIPFIGAGVQMKGDLRNACISYLLLPPVLYPPLPSYT